MELGARKEGLFEPQWGVTRCFYNQRDPVCIMEKHIRKSINPVAVSGCDAFAKVWGRIREMFTLDGCAVDWGSGDPVDNLSVD
jgi:hypothetical protein